MQKKVSYSFPYETQVHSLIFGHVQVSITCIDNFDDLFNALLEKGEDHEDYKDERLPYWADLWHSAIGLSQYLAQNEVIKPEMKVTEIGCGLGLPGIVAAKLGADVTMTDYLQETMDFLTINWQQNVDKPIKADLLDWRAPDSKFQADLLLASDVAYEKRSFEALIPALEVLSKPKSRIILTEPNRPLAKPFLKDLEANTHFRVTKSTLEVSWNDVIQQVNVLDLIRL